MKIKVLISIFLNCLVYLYIKRFYYVVFGKEIKIQANRNEAMFQANQYLRQALVK